MTGRELPHMAVEGAESVLGELEDGELQVTDLREWSPGAPLVGWPPALLCRATAVFWPDVEACEAECALPLGHQPADVHADRILGEWREDELITANREGEVA